MTRSDLATLTEPVLRVDAPEYVDRAPDLDKLEDWTSLHGSEGGEP